MLWPPLLLADEQHRDVRPGVLQHQPTRRSSIRRPAAIVSGPRYNGIVLPGDGFPSVGERPRRLQRSGGATRCSSARRAGLPRRTRTSSSRASACPTRVNEKTIVKVSAGVFHNRVTLNDSLLLGGNPPFQPQVSVSNGSVDNPGGAGGAAVAAVRHDRDRSGVQAPDRLHVFGRRAARDAAGASSSTRPTSAAAAATCSASATSTSCRRARSRRTRASTPTALRPYKGYGVIRLSENAGLLDVQQPAAGRRSPLQERLQVRRGLHARATRRTTPATSATCCSTRTTTRGYWGNSSFDRRHVFNFYYIYDLPFFQEQNVGDVARCSAAGRSPARRSCAPARRCG